MSETEAQGSTPPPLVSIRKLEQLLGRDRSDILRIAGSVGRHYEPFDKKKPNSNKWRHLDNPKEELKHIQKQILRNILSPLYLPETMFGGVPGCKIADNAAVHVGAPLLITLDLKNCFPSIHDKTVFSVFREKAGCSDFIAGILTKLTTFQHRLPQGAPTSSALANLCLAPLHDQLLEICQPRGLSLSFWVDDIAISGPGAGDGAFMEAAIKTIQAAGHSVGRPKVRRMSSGERQTVTGLVVNTQVSVPEPRRDEIWREVVELAQLPAVPPNRLASIKGKIQFIAGVSPLRGIRLKRLVSHLIPADSSSSPDAKKPSETRPCRHYGRRHRERNSGRPV